MKKTWTNHSLLFNANAICWNMSSHLFRHHANSARAQVRPEQHTLISVFKGAVCRIDSIAVQIQNIGEGFFLKLDAHAGC